MADVTRASEPGTTLQRPMATKTMLGFPSVRDNFNADASLLWIQQEG